MTEPDAVLEFYREFYKLLHSLGVYKHFKEYSRYEFKCEFFVDGSGNVNFVGPSLLKQEYILTDKENK